MVYLYVQKSAQTQHTRIARGCRAALPTRSDPERLPQECPLTSNRDDRTSGASDRAKQPRKRIGIGARARFRRIVFGGATSPITLYSSRRKTPLRE